jgi:sulfoxide reductase heme-binding subunit YedZ
MRISRFTKWVVILNCIVPVMLLAWDAVQGDLGANPVNFAIRTTGMLSLIFLVLSLTITPLSRLFGWSSLGQFRRVFGLYAFFHASTHFGLFFLFDRSANVADTLSEIGMRRYLLVGTVGLLIMLPLAITSTNGMIQRLGPKRWKMLHRSAYIAAAAGTLHYFMLVKADTTLPLLFAAVLSVLFGYRLVAHYLQLRSDSHKYRTAATMPAREVRKPGQWIGSSGLNAMLTGPLGCLRSASISWPVVVSQILTSLSEELPEAKRLPSGLKARHTTRPECPGSERISPPVSDSRMLMRLLSAAANLPSELKERIAPKNLFRSS